MTTPIPAAALPDTEHNDPVASAEDTATPQDGEVPGTALEIQNGLTGTIYSDGGDDPIPREVWDTLDTDLPRAFYQKFDPEPAVQPVYE